ncbi:MAG: recombination mediator RecR [Candidatus Dojkabacteria bacterium]
MKLPRDFKVLVNELEKLPGVGHKSATRLALFLVQAQDSNALSLAQSLQEAKKNLRYCEACGALSDEAVCEICAGYDRDRTKICIVENIVDLLAVERTGFYNGLYHVLGGVISPLEGVDETSINLESLFPRLDAVNEVIYALPSSIEADATFMVIKERIHAGNPDIQISKVAIGLPIGSSIDYADDLTLIRSFENRISG